MEIRHPQVCNFCKCILTRSFLVDDMRRALGQMTFGPGVFQAGQPQEALATPIQRCRQDRLPNRRARAAPAHSLLCVAADREQPPVGQRQCGRRSRRRVEGDLLGQQIEWHGGRTRTCPESPATMDGGERWRIAALKKESLRHLCHLISLRCRTKRTAADFSTSSHSTTALLPSTSPPAGVHVGYVPGLIPDRASGLSPDVSTASQMAVSKSSRCRSFRRFPAASQPP